MSRAAFRLIPLALLAVACQPKQTGQTRTDATAAPPTAGPAPAASDRAAVVGRVDGEAVTMGEVEDFAKAQLARAQSEYLETTHGIRANALDRVIDDRLVAKKAKAEKLTPEKLLERDVYSKIQNPSEADLKGLYDQAVAAGKQLPPFDQIKEEIAKFIKEKKAEETLNEYHEKLRAEAKVERNLPPLMLPKVEVAAVGPSLGEAAAPVTIIEFSDYQCPYCSRAEPVVRDVLAAYKGKVRLVYREFPLPIHDNAQKAAEAALCALDQGKYWEMHEKLFANQNALEVGQLKQYAKDLSLDAGKFDKCLDAGDKAATVAASLKAGEEVGVSGTPAFFINGRPLSGAQPFERFKEIIDAELASAGK